MPNLNGTGPEGKGRMTGRGAGNCEGAYQRNNCGSGRRRLFRNNFSSNDSTSNEIQSLKDSIEELKSKLDKLNS